ncbi:hypothetical protein WN943_008269 [Citrus x changshan-huyou]
MGIVLGDRWWGLEIRVFLFRLSGQWSGGRGGNFWRANDNNLALAVIGNIIVFLL